MNRRLVAVAFVAASLLVAPTGAVAKGGGGGHGGGGGGGAATGPYSLRYYNCSMQYTGDGNGVVVDGFTRGTSVDGGKMAVTLDGANCFNTTVSPTSVAAIGFRDFWEIGLDEVTALKASFTAPLTQGGSPRISIELYDGTTYVGDNNLFLSPSTCGSPNGNGWITADFRNSASCSFTDSAGHVYTGTPAYTDGSLVFHPAVSAWDNMLASGDHSGDKIWYAYAIADQSTVNRIDRITLNGQVFTS
jgi:hypothetical protein